MWSHVLENVKVNNLKLSQGENLNKAYLDKDFEKLASYFDQGIEVDFIISQGKTLLYKSVEDRNYKMADFLVGYSADPNKKLNINKKVVTPMSLAQSYEPEERGIFINILNGNLSKISQFLFFHTIENTVTNGEYDLEWLDRLYNSGVQFIYLSEDEFYNYFISKATLSINYEGLYQIIFKDLSRLPVDKWKMWVEKPFISGTYRKADCKIIENNQCLNFEGFLQTCPEKMHVKLDRAQNKIMPYLHLRNGLLGCN